MKGRYLITALLVMAGMRTVLAQEVVFYFQNGAVINYDVSELKDIKFLDETAVDEHDWVDLELPSGALWATMNVGANVPEEYGNFFAWGETQPKDNYSWNTYQHANSDGSTVLLTKYCNNYTFGYNSYWDTYTELQPSDDAATANWGAYWQMPSNEQWAELLNSENISTEWVTQNGQQGLKVTSNRNGKSIFLPGAGYYEGTQHDAASASTGYHAIYWSRSLYTQSCEKGCAFYGGRTGVDVYSTNRFWGQSIRPVRKSAVPVTEIKLDNTRLVLYLGRQGYESAQLTATILPENASNKNVMWESDNEAVAIVDQTGVVTAVGVGYWGSATCTITCRAADGSGVYAECQITVESKWSDDEWD
jgi:uncharacterized protein YjdB